MKIKLLFSLVLCFGTLAATAQNQGTFSGDIQLNTNFFMRDTLIGAANTPQYDRQKSSSESWLNLNYSNKGFNVGVRFDLYNNSNLLVPSGSFSAVGIGRFSIQKTIDKLDITGGYFYDQIGSGILFRAYEARFLGIDNSLAGARVVYKFNDNWKIKAFTGKQRKLAPDEKQLLAVYDPLIMGATVEGFMKLGGDSSNVSIAPGVGAIKRTLDDNTMNSIFTRINTDPQTASRFVPRYNTYGFSLFNTLTIGDFSWYVEGAYKTHEAIPDPSRPTYYQDAAGSVLFTTLSYSLPKASINMQFKRTDNFFLRTSALQTLNRGFVSFLPPMQRQNTYRLTARYNAASQELGEWAYSAEVTLHPTKHLDFTFNYSSAASPNASANTVAVNPDYFREALGEATYEFNDNNKLLLGLQYQLYNQAFYETEPGVPSVQAITPYTEFIHRFSRKKSLRIESQYMFTKQDLGAWAFLLAEFSVVPHWTVTAAGLLNTVPRKYGERRIMANGKEQTPIFYPTVAIFYTLKASRFSLSYVKQPQGVVCTGGICRVEPAFSGFKIGMTSRF